MGSVRIVEVHPHQAFYRPGEEVRLLVYLTSDLGEPALVRVVATFRFLADEVAWLEQAVTVSPGDQTIELAWVPPPGHPRGYGVDLQVLDSLGTVLDTTSTSFDVLERWTQAPRYGFLTNFSPGRSDIEDTMDWLTRYHINGLQFYDWMYRHEDLLTEQEPYRDPLGRLLSRGTAEALIEAAHSRNIAAMPYTAIYGASVPFYQAHPDWALYKADGTPFTFGQNFLYIMDPSPDSPWTRHLMGEFAEVMQEMGFDGIHLDQYGSPKEGFDSQGNPVDLATAIPAFIELTKATITAIRPDATVVFNAVNNWPIEVVAPAGQDFVYIEVWRPYTLYQDLWKLIVNAQRLSGGKPVVLAAYIEPVRHRNARLADAVIFASGGYHIELGERGGMLADPYFPKHQQMSSELATVMRRYYDFAVRYENALALGTHDSTDEMGRRVTIEGVNTDPKRVYKKVWIIAREGRDFETISLINLLDIADPGWNGLLLDDPTPLDELRVRYQTGRRVERVWLASPDFGSPRAMVLDFEPGRDIRGNYIEFTVPRLDYWDLVVIEFTS
ncbi:MAG: glycoside hydrolase family 66 protein [Anaerolineae bacterium]